MVDDLPGAYSPISTISTAAADGSRAAGTYTILNDQWDSNGDGIDAEFSVVVDGVGNTTITVTNDGDGFIVCLLYTSPSPRDATLSRMPSSA